MQGVATVVGLLVVLTGALGLGAFALQRQVLFPAPSAGAARVPAGVEVLEVGPERDVDAWLMLPERDTASPAIVFTHGNGELIDHWVFAFEEVRNAGYAVLLVEYPGYGRSGGSPSEASIRAVMLDAYDQLVARPEIDARRVIAHGRSLGGGAACQLARERELAALVLESSFTSVADVASGIGFPRWLIRDPFESREVVERFDGPVLVIHGEHDQVIPVEHGRALAAAANVEPIVLRCGHNNCPFPWPRIEPFLREHDLAP